MIHGHKTYKDIVKEEKWHNVVKEKGRLLVDEYKPTSTVYYKFDNE